MISDESPEYQALSPETLGGTSVGIMIYVEDVDSFTEKAVGEGLKVLRALKDHFYSDRSGTLEDPYGHKWYISTHIEDVSPEEMNKRAKEIYGG